MNKRQLGEDSLKEFIKSLHKLLITEKRKFDLIASAGDSGQVMVKITKIVFEILELPVPVNIVFPIYRYKNYPKRILFDNSTIINDYFSLQIPKNINNILFVDDEIEHGNAAEVTFKILTDLIKKQDFVYTIVAEDGGFNPVSLQKKNYKIKYISPKKRVDGVYNAISFAIPNKYENPIQSALEKENSSWNNMQIMCILLNLPIKELNNGKPEFNFRMQEIVKRSIPNLGELQKSYQEYFVKKINIIINTCDRDNPSSTS